MQTYKFHVSGMHCKACTLLIESEIKELSGVEKVHADLNHHTVEVSGNFFGIDQEVLSSEMSSLVEKHGYTISVEKKVAEKKWAEFKVALPAALIFIMFFVYLQKTGLVNLVSAGNVSFGTAFLIGIIASLSSCMAVVGGLILSMSATYTKSGDRFIPQALFHAGRIISFFILGGVIGLAGTAFELSSWAIFSLSMIIGLVMLIMGINLLDVFHFAKRFQPGMPKFISRHAVGLAKINHTLTPFLIGVATFFLPCGFTQAMQIYTLSTGGFLKGGLTMLSFALGTFPVLALLSFGSSGIKSRKASGIFFKTAGLVVIFFAVFNIASSLAAAGIINPLFNF